MSFEKKIAAVNNFFLLRPKTSGVVVFIILVSIFNLTAYFRYQAVKESEQRDMTNILGVVKQNIEQTLRNSYVATMTLALTIDDSGNSKNFEEIAKHLVSEYNHIDAVQLVPNGIIKYIYPLNGNEAALNFDILNYPREKAPALKAIKNRSIYFSGPIKLKQGGFGVVGRLPIFKKEKFWGFSAVILRFDTFIKSTGIESFKNDEYYFQLSKIDPISHEEIFFLTNKINFKKKNFQKIDIPEGDWNLYIFPKNESKLILAFVPIGILSYLLSLLCGVFITTLLKKPSELQKLVKSKTVQLAKSEFLFKSIFEHAGLGITHNNSNDGSYIDANDKFCELIGYNKEELKSMDFMRITHPEDLQADLDNMARLKKGEINQFSMEKRYFDKKGNVIWVNITVSPLWEKNEKPSNHITIVENINQRKEAEKLILESQQKIKDLIDSIDGIVWEGNSQEPGVTYVSKKSEAMLGYKPEEWIADDYFWRKIIHPDDREWVIERSIEYAKTEKPFDSEYRIIHKNGSTVWVRDMVSVYYESEGIVKFRGILIDITKSKQFEIDLNNSLTLVTEQNKRLLNFSHIVSHNLRSHTSNIQSLISLIEICETEDEEKELLVLLKSVSEALNETMDNLNEVVSIQTNITPVIEELNLNKFINRTLEVLRNQIIKNDAEIINKISDDVTVNFNPAYLESVLLNFISNSIRYKHPDRNPIIELNSYIEENYRILKIKDNGIGIDLEKNGEKLFGMYKTFTTNPESRGIGLFITKNQIDAMKGKIEVESTLNEGTTFKIYFK